MRLTKPLSGRLHQQDDNHKCDAYHTCVYLPQVREKARPAVSFPGHLETDRRQQKGTEELKEDHTQGQRHEAPFSRKVLADATPEACHPAEHLEVLLPQKRREHLLCTIGQLLALPLAQKVCKSNWCGGQHAEDARGE